MQNNILIVGGKGLVGGTINRILQERQVQASIFIGTRNPKNNSKELLIDVNTPSTFESITANKIDLIVLAVNDSHNNILLFAQKHGIDYVDITKPTPALVDALQLVDDKTKLNSRIVFGSGWMGGIVPGLVFSKDIDKDAITTVRLMVYYSIEDKAGESSAHFMAENVAVPFVNYVNKETVEVLHFLDSEQYSFSFGLGKREVYNFDTPDLYILNQKEGIDTVKVKMTYNSKLVTSLLGWMQRLSIFKRMSLSARRKVFGGSGAGDVSVFEVLVDHKGGKTGIALESRRGQAELTALSAVLHVEKLLSNTHEAGKYFAHQLYETGEVLTLLNAYPSITIKHLS
ncbi:saccharopine dehydrogenase family protein [Myroides pelagicus]|uniref:Saccharopine dehydrogenase n=1 Tax=Myroides pelagicus TaxID=270914 RepID=A0A7K1GNM3_9FLAO|nr:saccharopine dehydrogenase [Myroides pelagicus]MTH30139.1 saccharopine dehydrogenase [Myroides pelagicus]